MSRSGVDRRRFLAQMGQLATAASVSLAIPRVSSGQTSKALIKQADFSYLGTFRIPASSNGIDTDWGAGLAYRYVSGQLRFFSTVFGPGGYHEVYEMAAPAPKTSSPSTASIVRHWGDIYQGKRWLDKYGNGTNGTVYGLYWDAPDQRLYWSYGDGYNASNNDDCSLGYSTLNDSSGASSAGGAWRFTSRGEKMCRSGVLPLPQWFADGYCSGRRLGVGFGGYYSAATTGPASMGPALAAFSPPSPSTNKSSLAATDLIGYPFNSNAYTAPDRAHRDTDYSTTYDGWQPRNGVGYWTWNDTCFQSGAWIDLATTHGVLFGAAMGNGRVWYETSDRHAERGSHWFFVYDPADLAAVAQGSKKQYEIQPKASWSVQFPGVDYPLAGWQGDPNQGITGMAFDPSNARLYVMVRFTGAVHVYQLGVGTGTPPAAPAAPTNVRVIR